MKNNYKKTLPKEMYEEIVSCLLTSDCEDEFHIPTSKDEIFVENDSHNNVIRLRYYIQDRGIPVFQDRWSFKIDVTKDLDVEKTIRNKLENIYTFPDKKFSPRL